MRRLFLRHRRRYSGLMPISRRMGDGGHVLPFPTELVGYEGRWVAVYQHKVVFASHNSRDVAAWIRNSGLPVRAVTIQYVKPESESYVVGAG